MRKKWLPTKENIEIVISKIDAEKLYTRQQAVDEFGIAGSIFDRHVRLSSIWIAYGKPVTAANFSLCAQTFLGVFSVFRLFLDLNQQQYVEIGVRTLEILHFRYHFVISSKKKPFFFVYTNYYLYLCKRFNL